MQLQRKDLQGQFGMIVSLNLKGKDSGKEKKQTKKRTIQWFVLLALNRKGWSGVGGDAQFMRCSLRDGLQPTCDGLQKPKAQSRHNPQAMKATRNQKLPRGTGKMTTIAKKPLVASLFLVAMPGAPSSFLFLVASVQTFI